MTRSANAMLTDPKRPLADFGLDTEPASRHVHPEAATRPDVSSAPSQDQARTAASDGASPLDSLVARDRGEYREMFGLRLTVSQACRLWQFSVIERETVLQALSVCRWNKSKAARRLGLSRTRRYVRMRRYGLEQQRVA